MPENELKRIAISSSVPDNPSYHTATYTARVIEGGIAASRAAATGTRMALSGDVGLGTLGIGGISGGASLPASLAAGSALATYQFVLSRNDRLGLYRYFSKTDPYVSRAIKLHTELPLSRMSLGAPDGPSSRENREINRIYENMIRRLGLFEFILDMRRESLITGDAFVWCTWDEDIMEFTDLYLLPTEYMHVLLHPYIRRKEIIIFARPIVGTASLRTMTDRDLFFLAGDPDIQPLLDDLDEDVPEELRSLLDYGEGHALNTDPRKGSFCFHYKLNPTSTEAYGSSMIECILESLLRSENLKNANLNITQRNMNPKHLIIAENASQDELDAVRAQVDLSFLEPMDFPIITNFPVTWQIIGPNDRLLNSESEYATIKQQLMAGLGVTEEMLTGAATYGGSRFTMELLNTQYLNDRTRIIEFIEEYLFRPVAEAHGHYYHEKIPCWIKIDPEELRAGDEVIHEHDGTLRRKVYKFEKSYTYSRVRFNRLSVRDNAEVYDQLFQLHQKGSLDLRYLLELHNIDPEENANAMLESVGTIRDPIFNRILEGAYARIGDYIYENTDLKDRAVKGLNLDQVSKARGESAPGTPTDMTQTGGVGDMGFDSSFGGGFSPVPGGGAAPVGGEDLFGAEEGGGMGPEGAIPGEPVTIGGSPGGTAEPTASGKLPGKRLTTSQVKRLVQACQRGRALTKGEVREIVASFSRRKK